MTYEELLAENLRLRARIRELEQENARLKGYGSSLLCEPEPPQYGSRPVRPERDRDAEIQRRLDIFRGLFRGRDDVFAQRFVSKAGKAGYQPVCKNRWSPKCTEHKRKCEGCPFREFIPLDDTAIRRHLDKNAKEKDVIGIYPILEDNTVYFLCADFDDKNCEHGYKDDVLSYIRVCKEWGVSAYIERSRSGRGAHVWIFFEEPILAADARRLGFAIIGAAMESNVRLDMKSYDRFLPNQDFLPKGGFGNLIAIPLQGLARKSGNSVFVDESFDAFKDQWSLLSLVRKLSASELKSILATHAYQIELSYRIT